MDIVHLYLLSMWTRDSLWGEIYHQFADSISVYYAVLTQMILTNNQLDETDDFLVTVSLVSGQSYDHPDVNKAVLWDMH